MANYPDKPVDLFTRFAKARIIEVLRAFFTLVPDPRFRYTQDEKTSPIEIADKYTYNLPTAEQQRKIIVGRRRNPVGHKVIDQFKGEGRLGDPGGNFSDLIGSNLAIQCISGLGVEAERIADLVVVCLMFFRRVIRESIPRFHDIRVLDIGPEQPLRVDAGPEVVGVVVSVNVLHNVHWKVSLQQETEFKELLLSGVISFQEVDC